MGLEAMNGALLVAVGGADPRLLRAPSVRLGAGLPVTARCLCAAPFMQTVLGFWGAPFSFLLPDLWG